MTKKPGLALVTGASAGVGAIYADRLARRGFDLILVARRGDRLSLLADRLSAEHGVAVETTVADLAAPAELERIEALIEKDERITMLVNNAGIATLAPSVKLAKRDVSAMIDLNVTALVRLTLAALPRFISRDGGAIINIASNLAFESLPMTTVYSATKSYVLTFTRGLQKELAGSNVVVQLVAPGAMPTDLWEISGVPISKLDPKIVMKTDDAVDAALAGFDLREPVTIPALADLQLLADYDAARVALLSSSNNGRPAARYR